MQPIFLDIETSGLDVFSNKITLVQTLYEEKIRLNRLKPESIPRLKKRLENNMVVGHNLKFDLKFLKHYFNIEPIALFDTWVAEILISGGMKARQKGATTLEVVAEQYTGIKLNKDSKLRQSFQGNNDLTHEQIQYAAYDVAVLPEIYRRQQQQLKELELEQVFEIEMACIPATIWLELSGVPLDMEGLKKLEFETKQKLESSRLLVLTILKNSGYKNLDLTGLPAVNLNSPVQLKAAMRAIGLNVESTKDSTLSNLVHPIGKALKEYRKLQKLLNMFIEKLPGLVNPVTGRIHSNFNQCGTVAGRFSCSGPNLQQLPRDNSIRQLFKSSRGSKIINADYSQIELRIIAEVSQEPKFIEIYKNNKDLHKLTASLILGKPEAEVTKEERQLAKPINFGLSYGLGPQSLCDKVKKDMGIDIGLEQAKKFRETFFQNYPQLNRYLQYIAAQAVVE